MTDLKMTAKEALAELTEFLGNLEGRVIMSRSRTALATLTALVEENAALKAELARLKPLTDLMKAVFSCQPTPQTDPKAGDVGQEGEK